MTGYRGKFDHDRTEVTQDGEWLVVTTGAGYTGRAPIGACAPFALAACIARDPSALTTEGDYDDEGIWHDQEKV